jgi:hypothetical protein
MASSSIPIHIDAMPNKHEHHKRHKLPETLASDEHIRPDQLARVIKKEKPTPGEKLKNILPDPRNYKKFQGERKPRKPFPRGIIWGILGLAVFFILASIASFYFFKTKIRQVVSRQENTLQTGIVDLENFDLQGAEENFASFSASSTSGFANVFGAFTSFGDIGKQLTTLSTEANALESGSDLVTSLTSIRVTLASIDADANNLSGAASSLNASSSFNDQILPLKAKIDDAENFLNAFIPWLSSPTPHHILLLFENSSEMRPGGGFLGSYADVTVASGTIISVDVHDIADVDVGFVPKIIPPLPLQLENSNLRPADANWFLDFPTSASETLSLFAQSKLYRGANAQSSTTFDTVIAVSPKVVGDLLSLVGPITVSSTKTQFTSDNFMVQMQSLVQKGQATQSTYPKAAIGQLAQAIIAHVASSTSDEKQALLPIALNWISDRDVMFYSTNPAFEGFFKNYGAAGDVYELPQNFNGDYLSIADADINSDKSELYVAQKVSFDAQIGADGTITDSLIINRTHDGNQSPYWWYQTTNQDYVQVFVPEGSALMNESGGIKKTVPPPINYTRSGYSTDPLIATITSTTQSLFIYPNVTTHEEDSKEVFAVWSRVAKGATTQLAFDYTHRAFIPPAPGVVYQFIFDKQPGSMRTYDFEIDAPLGYVFAENGLASYEYTSSNPPGRLIVNLTLEKI